MKKAILYLVMLFFSGYSAFSQDMIFKRNGNTIKAKVLKVGIDSIEYKNFNDTDGLSHRLLKSEVGSIAYENGVKDVFSEPLTAGGIKYDNRELTLSERGKMDAKTYYKGYKPAMIGTAICSLYPGYGVIPALICSLTPPRYSSLKFPYPELMDNALYREAYTEKAYKIKKGKVWEGFGIGSAVLVVTVAVILSVATQH